MTERPPLGNRAAHATATLLRAAPLPRGKFFLAEHLGRALGPHIRPKHQETCLPGGVRMRLNLRDRFERYMFYVGQYEPGIEAVLRRLLPPGAVAIDGGANIGYMTLQMARLVGHAGQVHAFEPVPDAFAALTANLALNDAPQVRANRAALAEAPGELTLHFGRDPEQGEIVTNGASRFLAGECTAVAPAVALDDYAAECGLATLDLVKLDIEGGEEAAECGLTRLLAAGRVRCVICEVNLGALGPAGLPREAAHHILRGHGYRAWRIGPLDGRLTPEEGADLRPAPAVADYLYYRPV